LKNLKVLLLNSNQISGTLSPSVSNLAALQQLSLFDNKMVGQVPFDIEKLKNLKEMNVSYNQFSGLVSKDMAKLDVLNMTMINDKGVAAVLKVSSDKNTAIASEE
jgi:Leucine-rich repeat (LRR) protein